MLGHTWGQRHIRMQILEGAGHELPPSFVRTVRNVLYWVAGDRVTRADARTVSARLP